MISDEISQKRHHNIVDNASWLLLDGNHEFRGMMKEEITAFIHHL
ncbi:hypothetical protein [Bacillus multifaciens]|nr:hypothetical protein [Bacillus sp. WLY-B-L8]MDP7977745.1 hypothetical protein [Bacillus sp. WLY-B-L8]